MGESKCRRARWLFLKACSIRWPTPLYREVRFFFFSSRRRHTRYWRDWSSDVCSSDLGAILDPKYPDTVGGNLPWNSNGRRRHAELHAPIGDVFEYACRRTRKIGCDVPTPIRPGVIDQRDDYLAGTLVHDVFNRRTCDTRNRIPGHQRVQELRADGKHPVAIIRLH